MTYFIFDQLVRTPNSSAISELYRNDEKDLVVVSFNNGKLATYVMGGQLWNEFTNAESVGRFYNNYILGNPNVPGQSSDWEYFVRRNEPSEDKSGELVTTAPPTFLVTLLVQANSITELGQKLDAVNVSANQIVKVERA